MSILNDLCCKSIESIKREIENMVYDVLMVVNGECVMNIVWVVLLVSQGGLSAG